MISPEPSVFNEVATVLRATYSGIFVGGETSNAPARFPATTLIEEDNAVYEKASTTNIENAVKVLYALTVFSNKTSGAKQECQKIIATADSVMASLGFTRYSSGPITNLPDDKIYRMVARYTGVCDKNYTIYTK